MRLVLRIPEDNVTLLIRLKVPGRYEYDITLFSFGATIRCDCGETVSALEPRRAPAGPDEGAPPLPALRAREARRRMAEISRGADRIASMILFGEFAEVDVAIAVERLRDRTEELFPGSPIYLALRPTDLAAFPRSSERYRIVTQSAHLTLLALRDPSAAGVGTDWQFLNNCRQSLYGMMLDVDCLTSWLDFRILFIP